MLKLSIIVSLFLPSLFQQWLVGAPSDWPLCCLDVPLCPFPEAVLDFGTCTMPSSVLHFPCSSPGSGPFSGEFLGHGDLYFCIYTHTYLLSVWKGAIVCWAGCLVPDCSGYEVKCPAQGHTGNRPSGSRPEYVDGKAFSWKPAGVECSGVECSVLTHVHDSTPRRGWIKCPVPGPM